MLTAPFVHGVDLSGVVVVGVLLWCAAIVALVLLLLVLVAAGSRADRRRRDVDIALGECLGLGGEARVIASASHGLLVKEGGRAMIWRSTLLVPDDEEVQREAASHMVTDARREITHRGLTPLGQPQLDSHWVVWVADVPGATTGTYLTAARARAIGIRQRPTLAMLRVAWRVAGDPRSPLSPLF